MDTQVLLSFCKARQTLYPLLGIAIIESDSSSYADYLFASPSFKERMELVLILLVLMSITGGARQRNAKAPIVFISFSKAQVMRGSGLIFPVIKIRTYMLLLSVGSMSTPMILNTIILLFPETIIFLLCLRWFSL